MFASFAHSCIAVLIFFLVPLKKRTCGLDIISMTVRLLWTLKNLRVHTKCFQTKVYSPLPSNYIQICNLLKGKFYCFVMTLTVVCQSSVPQIGRHWDETHTLFSLPETVRTCISLSSRAESCCLQEIPFAINSLFHVGLSWRGFLNSYSFISFLATSPPSSNNLEFSFQKYQPDG